MFIYSLRASTLKFFGIVSVTLVALIAIIAFVPVYAEGTGNTNAPTSGEVSYSYDKVKSSADAVNFLSQFGWTVDGGNPESAEVTIPAEFDKVFAAYNEIQKAQGLDLSKYKKKELTRYTFEVTNYKDYDCLVELIPALKEAGYFVVMVEDCCGSRKQADKESGLKRAMCDGVSVSCAESVLFELLYKAGGDTFKTISKLVK